MSRLLKYLPKADLATPLKAQDVGGGSWLPSAVLDFRKGRYLLTGVAAASIAAASLGDLARVFDAPFSDALVFTRSSTATFIDINGVMQTAAIDAPRYDYTNGVRQLLIEGASTNILTRSNAFSTNWTTTNSSVTGSQSGGIDGANSFSLWGRSSTAAAHVAVGLTKPATAAQYSLSFYVKQGSGRYCALRIQSDYPSRVDVTFDLQTGTISQAATTFGTLSSPSASIQPVFGFPSVYRVIVTATLDTSTVIAPLISFNSNNVALDGTDSSASSSGYVQFAQLEALPFASSYIPTTTVAVTRAADVCLFSAKMLALINRGDVTIVLKGRTRGLQPSGLLISSNNGNMMRQGTGNPSVLAAAEQTSPNFAALVTPAGVFPGPFGAAYSYAPTFRGVSGNGSTIATDANTNAGGLTAVSLGSAAGGTAGYLWADQLIIYPFRATNAEVQRLAAAYV